MQSIFIIAGEPSGDLHGSYLVKALLELNPGLKIQGWGGDKMQAAGAQILRELDQLAFMGFIDVIKNLGTVKENFSLCKKQIQELNPDVILFIDYPGFNLRMAKWAKHQGFKTVQYIAPQTWAWKEGRVKTIKAYIDKLIVILPFEEAYFKSHGIDAKYFGHPLVEEIQEVQYPLTSIKDENHLSDKLIISLFPGSRKQEIKDILPAMLSIIVHFPQFQYCIAGVEHIDQKIYTNILVKCGVHDISIVTGKNYELLANSELALISSGTATLEAAILDVPQIVCYKTSKLNYILAKKMIKLKYISLVNLISDRQLVPELIQEDLNQNQLKNQIIKLLNKGARIDMLKGYQELKIKLKKENTSTLVAKEITSMLE